MWSLRRYRFDMKKIVSTLTLSVAPILLVSASAAPAEYWVDESGSGRRKTLCHQRRGCRDPWVC